MNNDKIYYVVFGYEEPKTIQINEEDYNTIMDLSNEMLQLTDYLNPFTYYKVPRASINYCYVDLDVSFLKQQ